MFCTDCGQQNPDDGRFCTSCGQEFRDAGQLPGNTADGGNSPVTVQQYPPPRRGPVPSQAQGRDEIPNYLVQAIAVTICCCIPAGIVSIVYAAQVNGKVASGDMDGARQSSDSAKKWAWVAFGLGILGGVVSAALSL